MSRRPKPTRRNAARERARGTKLHSPHKPTLAQRARAVPLRALLLGALMLSLAGLAVLWSRGTLRPLAPVLGRWAMGPRRLSATRGRPFEVLRRLPHDSKAFTQGLFFHEGYLYESTGLYGESTLRKVDISTGKVMKQVDLEPSLFGEGITKLDDDHIVMLTWREQLGLVYNLDTLELERTFRFSTTRNEGWGIVNDGRRLIVSDGSATLHFWDPHTFEEIGRVVVRDRRGKPVTALNELELVHGELFANIWYSNKVARINPANGKLLGYIDFQQLHPNRDKGEDVFNGIAWDKESDTLYVTGKKWKHMYHTKLVGSQLKPRFPAPQTVRSKRPSAITPGLKAALKVKLAEEESRPKGGRTRTNNA